MFQSLSLFQLIQNGVLRRGCHELAHVLKAGEPGPALIRLDDRSLCEILFVKIPHAAPKRTCRIETSLRERREGPFPFSRVSCLQFRYVDFWLVRHGVGTSVGGVDEFGNLRFAQFTVFSGQRASRTETRWVEERLGISRQVCGDRRNPKWRRFWAEKRACKNPDGNLVIPLEPQAGFTAVSPRCTGSRRTRRPGTVA
jgi:hypothetical protein